MKHEIKRVVEMRNARKRPALAVLREALGGGWGRRPMAVCLLSPGMEIAACIFVYD